MTHTVDYSVLIPAFNAAKTLEKLLTDLNNLPEKPSQIIVINDGSTDKTTEIALKNGAIVEDLGTNGGKGSALIRGFDIFSNQFKSDFLICMDADLQHPPSSIRDFIEKLQHDKRAVLIGRRDINLKVMPFMRFLSNKITSLILGFLSGVSIPDSQCGFRLIPRYVLKEVHCTEKGFQLESEFILRCSQQNIAIGFVDIPTIYSKNGSHISHVSDTLKFIKLIIKEIFKR